MEGFPKKETFAYTWSQTNVRDKTDPKLKNNTDNLNLSVLFFFLFIHPPAHNNKNSLCPS